MSAALKAALEGGKVPQGGIPRTAACAVAVPIEAHVGSTFQDMTGTTSPQIDAYSKVLQVFFALYSKVPDGASARLMSEALLTPAGSLWGYRYIFLLDGQDVMSELDGFGHNEIILSWANVKGSPNKAHYAKTHGTTFGEQWMTFFQGITEWRRSLFVVFPDVDPQDSFAHLASRVFSFDQSFHLPGVCAEQNALGNYHDQQTQAFVFPKPQYVYPFSCIRELGAIKYPHVLQRELAVTRVSVATVLNLAMQMAALQPPRPAVEDAASEVARPPPAQRQRLDAPVAACRVPMTSAPADVHRFLPLAALQQSVKAVNQAIDKVADLKARYILRSFCYAQMGDAFVHALKTSPMRSPGDMLLMAYAAQSVDGVSTTSAYWNSRWLPVYDAASSSEALISKCLAAFEVYFSVDMCHHEALMLLFGASDCFRLAFETMKFSAWIFSKGGGVSKSFMLNLTRAISVKGLVKSIGRFTAAAFAVNGTAENPTCPNQTMQVIGIDDTDPDLFSETPKNTLQAAALKTAMTDQTGSVDTLFITESGDRIKKFIEAPLGGVFIVLANISRIAHQPLERRAQAILASEVASSTIDTTVIQSWEAGMSPRQQSFATEFRWLQYCQYMISQLQYAGLLPEFTYGAAGVILMEISDALKKDKDILTFTRIDTSVLQRMRSYARLLEINKICLDAFCSLTKDDRREIGVADFLKLAPRMFISVESICNAAMFLIDGWLPSLRFVVADALKMFVASKAAGGGSAKPLAVVDKTCLRFDFSEVVRFIVATAPSLTRNFTPNYDTVATHLRAFLSLPAEDSPCYLPAPDLPGKVVADPRAQAVKVVPYVETATIGGGSSKLDISIFHFQDLLVHNPHSLRLLSREIFPEAMLYLAQEASDFLSDDANPAKHRQCSDMPCSFCMAKKAKIGAEMMTDAIKGELDKVAIDLSEDSPKSRAALLSSFLWNPDDNSTDGLSTAQLAARVLEQWDVSGMSRVMAHFGDKMQAYLRSHFCVDRTSHRWEAVPDAPPIQWLETQRSAAVSLPARTESPFASASYEKVAKILGDVLNNRNQLPRRIFAGPSLTARDEAMFVEVGGGRCDPNAFVRIRLKDRHRKKLGKVDLHDLELLLGDLTRLEIKVNYDLDIWTQERHFEALGIDPSVSLSEELFTDLSDLLTTTSPQWDGYYLNGVEAKKLAPVHFGEMPQIAQRIKARMERQRDGDDDAFFPRAEIQRKVELARARNIPPHVFHLPDYNGHCKTMCFAPLRVCVE